MSLEEIPVFPGKAGNDRDFYMPGTAVSLRICCVTGMDPAQRRVPDPAEDAGIVWKIKRSSVRFCMEAGPSSFCDPEGLLLRDLV